MKMRILTVELTLVIALTGVLLRQGIHAQDYENVPEGAASLAFVFDITGSMYDDLVQVIEGAAKILATTLRRREKPLYNYVLVPFHDPVVGPVVVTSDPDDFQYELRNLYVQGGGDCPEMSVGAIKEAIDVCLPNSFIYVFTDARSKDFYLTEEVLALIQKKQSQVVFVLTGDCDDPTHEGYRAYEQIASTSSGQVFLLKKSQVNEVLNFVRVAVQSRKVNLMSVDQPTASTDTFTLPIDSRLQEVTISVSGQKPRITLIDPSGNRVTKKHGLKTLLDIRNALIQNVKEPLPGQWRMEVTSEGPHTIRVTGLSTTDFVAGFSRKPAKNIGDTEHRPVGGIPSYLYVNGSDLLPPAGFSRIELLDLNGRPLVEYSLDRSEVDPKLYSVEPFTPPEEYFYVKVSGIDDKGYVIQRLTPTAITRILPVKPTLWMPEVTRGYFGSLATVTCKVDSLVPFTVKWFSEEIQLGEELYFTESGNATLEIPNANQFSEGIYFCNATNSAGSRAIPTFLDISEPPPAITPPKNASVLPGEDAMVYCNVFSTVDYNVTWHRLGYLDRLRNSRKFTIYNNGSLIIRKVGLEDEGPYTCRASNEGGFTEKKAFVRVQVAPTAVITPQESSFVIGQTRELLCTAKGYPTPTVYWMRGGKAMIASENVRINGNELTLNNMHRGDAGLYACRAQNSAGEFTAVASLNYMEPPHISLYESRVLVASGDEATLFCAADGIPKPIVKWYRGEVELKEVAYVRITDSGQLKIIGTQELDAGEYRCEAVNDAGTDSALIRLEVGSDPLIIEGPSNQGVDIGGNSTMTCTVEGLPKPTQFWRRQDGRKLDLGGRVKQLPSGALFIRDVGIKDEGMYVCVAQNQFGTTEMSGYLTITGISRPLIGYMNPIVSVKEGDDLELNCQSIVGNPKPKLLWLQHGQVLRTDKHIKKNSNGNLIIKDVRSDHDGDYICLATNVGGNASQIVTVDVQVPPSFDMTGLDADKIDFNIVEGDRIILPCAVEGDPPPLITWYKDESPISLTDYHYFILEDGSLEIYTVDASDTGTYRCAASNIAGDIEKIINLFVQVIPKIAGDPSETYTVTEGETVVLPCDVSGTPPPTVSWRKNFVNFKPKSDRFLFGDYGMTITKTKTTDKAIYECIASNLAGNETKVITLIVEISPVITSEGPTEMVIQKGEEVVLGCENKGFPIPEVEWIKDESPISVFNEDTGFELQGTGSLRIPSVRISDSGRYLCIVSNDAGIQTRDFTLLIQDPPRLPENLTKYDEVIENNPIVLLCPAAGTPTPLITWYKDDVLITGDQLGFVILEDGSLQVSDSEAADSGVYRCVAENDAGKVEHEVDLKVLVPPKIIDESGKHGVVDKEKVVVTKNVTLTCPVEADPAPEITWLKGVFEIDLRNPRYSVSEDGKELTITTAEIDDTGSYTCIAENIAGETEKTFDLDVQVPPEIDSTNASPDNNTVIKNNPLYLDCPVSGIPRPKVIWYKDDEIISPDLDPNLRVLADGRRLEIIGARVTDTGSYKCVGENVAGKTEKEFDVDVHVPPKIDQPGKVDRPETVRDGTHSLTCPASGIPLPKITWYKNNKPIKENTTEYLLLNEGWTLKILSASEEDSARFTCRAKNIAGQSEKAFDLNVLVPPKINRDQLNLDPDVVINQTTVINCPVEGKPAPDITWYKNGVQLDATLQKRYEILAGGRQLRVKKAQLTDTGTYQCLAVNKAGEDSVDFELTVLVPSKIEIPRVYNTNRKVVQDGSLTIPCPAKGVPPPKITWYRYKDGLEVELTDFSGIEISEDGKQLTILEAKKDDSARYICRAKNVAGQSEIAYNVDVQVPPTIDKDEINPNPTVVIDDSVVLDCPAVGTPDPEVIWLKDGEPLDYENNRQYSLQANGKRLMIQSAGEEDDGIYTCVAANEAGSTEERFDLDVWVPPKIDDTDLDKNPKINKGHTSVMFCTVEGNPPPEILWLKDGEPLQLDNRVTLTTDGHELRIENASVSDTAKYTCRARNKAGQDAISFDLEVQVPPSIDESNVVYNRRVVQNRTIIIECPVSGIPTPEVMWLINDHPLQPSEGLIFTHNDYHLEILSAQVTDSAVYTCVASNEAGTLKKKFNVEVQMPPKINQESLRTELSIVQNRTAYIDCPVTGIPQPSIMWLKDDFPLLDWPYPDLRLLGNDRRLEISNAQVDDGGRYTCQATNPAGQIKQDFILSVQVPPSIGGSHVTKNVPVIKNKAVTLICLVAGTPEPRTTWLKDDKIIVLSENPHIRILNNGQSLQITNADIEDTGLYVCHAENEAGISEKSYDVEVHVPASIEGSEQLQTVWVAVNNPLTLECPAEGTPTPKIYWMRQGQVIQAYGNPSVRIEDNGRKLLLVSAQLPDLGDYKCLAENVAGNDSIEYLVSVYVPPIIDEGHTKVQAIVNHGAVLSCDSQGLPEPETSWEKDGEIFPTTGLRHKMQRFGSMEFISVRLEDAGIYRCTASNEAGNVSREIQLDVQVPPRIPWEQPMRVDAVVGRDVMLPCEVIGTPTPTILWQKGAREVQSSDGLTILENGTLYIHNTSMEDSGVYICIARNDAGTAFGQIRLRMQVPPKISIRQKHFIVSNGQNIVLPCRARGRPSPKITWMKNGRAVSSSNLYLRLLRTGLAIPFARPEDAGTYTCVATNKAGNQTVDMTLTVQVPPQIGETSRLLTYSVGEHAEITCPAIGIPPPDITWIKDGQPVDTTLLKYDLHEFGSLIVHDLTEEDTGSYICTASNSAGRATRERLLRIQVPPSFVVVPQLQEVLLNSRLVLRCTANGIPTPNIYWKHNDVVVPSPKSVNGRSTFTIPNVRREDGGMYTCIAQNPAGEAQTFAMVIVKVPPEILAPPGNKAITIAEKVVLECSVSGDPPPEVFWMKNGRPVELSDRIQQLSNGSLVIYQSTSSDAGEYKCVATNDAGTSEGVAMLTVREPPSFLIEPSDTSVEQGDTVRLDCAGLGEPEPKMDWMIGWDILKDEGRLSILPNNSLRIVAAQLSDSNTYRCLASNNLGKTFVEVNLTVIVHGQWSDWSDWESCSESCGKGTQLRHRLCASPEPANGGRDCAGLPVGSQPCTVRQCPVDGQWGNWMPWEECSVTCDRGEKVRRRLCDSPRQQYGGQPCFGDSSEIMECNLRPCAVDGGWGHWGRWQSCSTTCGEGVEERVRQCDNPLPVHRGAYCGDNGMERRQCKLKECPVDGMWGQWGAWAPCTLSCGGGTRTRLRLCNSPAPDYGGLFCVGTDTQVDYCNNELCPVHGGWSKWGDFGTCSKSCNGGLRRRFRTCTNPAPSANGRPCVDQGEDTETCNLRPCPVDGRWSEWSAWTRCSKSCDRGIKERSRQCRQPKNGGKRCLGDSVQRADCMLGPCFTIPVKAEGNLVGYINNIDIPDATFTADMIPLPDGSATRVNATLRNVPRPVVHHFRHLVSLLAPIYWTTAKELDGAFNGFSLTEGDFTREVQVEYTTGEILKMSHYSKGADRNGVLQLDLVVRGTVPEFPETQIVNVKPYWEEYLQTGEGTVHAQSTRLFELDDHLLPYAWNHSITYNRVDNKMPYLVQRLYARGMEVEINPTKEIVLLQLDASIGPGSPSNQCPTGFTLVPEGPYCVDDNECERLKPCSDFCHNSPGSFACSCPFGYTLDVDGRNCLDIDECSTSVGSCRGDQECVNTIGSYMCAAVCRRGFKRSKDGQQCIDINECEETPGVCSQICVNRYGSHRCRCRPGYRKLSRGRCIDIDECKLTSSPCSQLCSNSLGSYKCSCHKGYELVRGGLCRDINECTEGGSTCSPGQDCINSIGSYRCISLCQKGSYSEDGKCRDIDECAIGKHRCYSNQRCVNTDPGYKCLCPRGYKSAGPGTPCLDINECEEDHGICQHNCTNTIGSYKCSCPPGYRLSIDGRSCEDIDECLEYHQDCGPEKMCFNMRGDFTCIDIPCPEKYQRDPLTNYCVLECIDAEIACPANAKFADVIEFRTLALPSGIVAHQDLIRLIAYNQNNEVLTKTVFRILENDKKIDFQIRLENGIGIVYTLQPLEDQQVYKVKVRARSYDNSEVNIQYQTTFIIHISVSAYPY